MPTPFSSGLPRESAGKAAPDLTGQTLDDFIVLRRLGQGGMGQVYLAEQRSLKRRVALKVMMVDFDSNAVSLQRFQAEGEAVARASHANIVQVYAIGKWQGLNYMALEYVDGFNLRQYVEKKGPPGVALALSIMRQVALALQRAGELDIVHRDIKPENILLSRKGEVKVADFGLSRRFAADTEGLNLTQSGVALGTPLYMSPEQIEGKSLDPRSDIYSFGITCYWMLAGEAPFRGQSAFEVAMRHVQTPAPELHKSRPDLPVELCALIQRMIAKKPEDRPQTGRELVKEINRLRDRLSVGPRSADTPGTSALSAAAPSESRRSRIRWLFAGSLVLAAIIGLGFGLRSRGPADGVWSKSMIDKLPDPAPAPPTPAQAREKFLREAVEQYAHPKNGEEFVLGFGHRVELALFYLDAHRLAEAEQFFKRLTEDRTPRPYHALGLLGSAIVLADRDQPVESDRKFLEFLGDKERLEKFRGAFNRNVKLVAAMADAVNRNAINCQAKGLPFPPELEKYRKPYPLVPPPAANPARGR